jgi:predicted ester cyclase
MKTSVKTILLFIITCLIVTGCHSKSKVSNELKPLVYKYIDAWNSGNLGQLDPIIDLNFVYHSNQSPIINGIDELKKSMTNFRSTFPDMKLVLTDEIYSENEASCMWSLTGTNTGKGAMRPTGKSIKIWGTSVFHFANGKITGEWTAFDNLSILSQLSPKMKTSSKRHR